MNKKCKALTKEEYEKLVEVVQYGFTYKGVRHKGNSKVAAICIAQANTGLRIGDVLSLRLKDIIMEHGRYHFNGLREQKTDKERNFTIAPEVVNFLQGYALEHGISPDRKLFDITSRGVNKVLKVASEYLGLENIGSHSFRKFFAMSIYNDNDFNVELVRELLQHSSVSVTQHYLGVSPVLVEKALLNHVYIPSLSA